eukprot:jgi/Bigna1/132005/aug1.16_g6713
MNQVIPMMQQKAPPLCVFGMPMVHVNVNGWISVISGQMNCQDSDPSCGRWYSVPIFSKQHTRRRRHRLFPNSQTRTRTPKNGFKVETPTGSELGGKKAKSQTFQSVKTGVLGLDLRKIAPKLDDLRLHREVRGILFSLSVTRNDASVTLSCMIPGYGKAPWHKRRRL